MLFRSHSLLLTLGMCKSTGTTGMTQLLVQQPVILAEFGKVRIKLLEMTFKGKQNIFPHHQPLYCLVLTFRSNYDACCHSFSTSIIDLHVDSARIFFGYCTNSCVILVVPVDLHIPSVRSSECKHVMACIGVG